MKPKRLPGYMTTSEACQRYGIEPWQARRSFDAICDCPRVGLFRVLPIDLVPLLENELRRHVWLRRRPEVGAA